MGKRCKSRRGSLAFRPRKRAECQRAHISSWPTSEQKGLLGFSGYKAGMTHVLMIDDIEGSPTKGMEVSIPVTIIETPPVVVFGLRAYEKTPYGKKTISDMLASDEKILAPVSLPKNDGKKLEEKKSKISDIALLIYTTPARTGFSKKRVEPMEIALGGKDANEKLEYAKNLLGKEVRIADVFKEGEYVDVAVVTTGKGWQGAVKRFGVKIQRRKATGKRRHVGTLGPWHPARVMYTAPQAGQMGYHTRTEINKRILKIGANGSEVNPKGGLRHYGIIKGEYILVKGSVGGPVKRILTFRKSVRMGDAKVSKPAIRQIVSVS